MFYTQALKRMKCVAKAVRPAERQCYNTAVIKRMKYGAKFVRPVYQMEGAVNIEYGDIENGNIKFFSFRKISGELKFKVIKYVNFNLTVNNLIKT